MKLFTRGKPADIVEDINEYIINHPAGERLEIIGFQVERSTNPTYYLAWVAFREIQITSKSDG